MANMSYCRFNNTLLALEDCIDAITNRDISSEEEKRKARYLFIEFLEFCQEEHIIDRFDLNRIDKMISECEEQ